MQMRKNIKFKPNNIALDVVVVLASVLLFSLAVFLLILNLNKTFENNDKVPVAVLTFKYKTVQRKFLDRAVWDRPIQNSPVYNGDTIRTAPEAEATLHFADSSVVNLGANTMLQIFVSDEVSDILLNQGTVSVKTFDSVMNINSKNSAVSIEKNSVLHADKAAENDFKLVVEKGQAAVMKNSEVAGSNGVSTEILNTGSVFVEGESERVTVISPAVNSKILNQNTGKEKLDVPLKWHSSFSENEELILEVAPSKTFTQNVQRSIVTGMDEFTVSLNAGVLFWRVYSQSKGPESESAAFGKFTVQPAPPPELFLPENNSNYKYLTQIPDLRFVWSGNKFASSYLLEVSDSPSFDNSVVKRNVVTESLTLREFGEGVWYWRVTPIYAGDKLPEVKSSPVFSFKIETSNEMPAPEPILPQLSLDTASGRPANFSWHDISEAESYKISIFNNADSVNPVFEKVVTTNFCNIENSSDLFADGDYFWTVAGIDKNGKVLNSLTKYEFQAFNSKFELRSIYPHDGYIISDIFCRDTRFTWKTTLEAPQRFQVSSLRSFSGELLLDIETSNPGIDGINLPIGEYYWRVVSTVGSREVKTEPKKVIIAGPLDKPSLINASETITIFPGMQTKFDWTPVKGADYYQVRISAATPDAEPIYEDLFVTKVGFELPLHDAEDGEYRISIQSFALQTKNATRRYGKSVDHYFELRHIKPVSLIYPEDNAQISGLDAYFSPPVLEWFSPENLKSSQLLLEKLEKGKRKVILEVKSPEFKVTTPSLAPGNYIWRINALTKEEFDISAEKNYRFTITPVPPLPMPAVTFPKDGAVFTADFFKDNRAITFRWNAVKSATHYLLQVFPANSNVLILQKEIAAVEDKDMSLQFTDIHKLSRGNFTVAVKAIRKLPDGSIFQDGVIRKHTFMIDLPVIKQINTEETGVLYGK